jgi:hypothetical protein
MERGEANVVVDEERAMKAASRARASSRCSPRRGASLGPAR